MKITLNWLKDHLETNASLEDIAEALVSIGLEVEGIDSPAERLKGFVIARVAEAGRHPDADRLSLCQIDDGSGSLLQVVCGAQNVRQGMKVAFARIGTVIPTGQPLKKGTIRGVESNGMLCSSEELLLGESSDGIMDLQMEAEPGTDLAIALELNDAVIEISITPNRSDCFSVRGIAKDLAAYGLGTLKPLNVPMIESSTPCPVSVTITDVACSHFTGRVIEGVSNGQSPDWVQKRLIAVGQRCISALVDVTNYICLDMGRPLHVFDADKLQGNIVVRSAKDGETLQALNANTYELKEGMIAIADNSGVLSLGGIMGGISSSCTPATTRVFLESAYFEPSRIATTGQSLRIISDSRTRFERGVDPMEVALGLDRATQLIIEWCGGKATHMTEAGQTITSAKKVTLSQEKLSRYAGENPPSLEDAKEFLERLNFKILAVAENKLTVEVPSWRHDISLDVDLIEEILRLRGYEAIPAISLPLQTPNRNFDQPQVIRRTLSQRGLMEVYTWSFIDEETAEKFGQGIPLEVPLSQEMAVLRPSLFPSQLKAIASNQSKSILNSSFFELACQYEQNSESLEEKAMVAGLRSGETSARHWKQAPRCVDIFDAKADAIAVLEIMGITAYQIEAQGPEYYHPGRKGTLKQGNKILAYFGEIHPTLISNFQINGPVVGFEVFIDNLPKEVKRKITPLTLSPYQAVTRDFAFIISNEITADQILKTMQKVDKTILHDVSIFDVYSGDKLPKGQKSLGIQVRLQAADKTLNEEDLSKFSAALVSAIEKSCGGVLRNA